MTQTHGPASRSRTCVHAQHPFVTYIAQNKVSAALSVV